MIEAFFTHTKDQFEQVLNIRKKVFIEEQKVPEEIERDLYDDTSSHVIVYYNSNPVATGRLLVSNDEYLIGRIAVLRDMRGKSLGDLVVKMLINKAFNMGAQRVYVHSQVEASGFYKKIGFKEYGQVYYEAGIEHINMYIEENMIKKCKG